MSAATSYPVPRDLAEDARGPRSERQSRGLLVGASFQMQDRVGHPDGGDCPVEDVLLHEEAQRAQIDQETADGSLRKHRRLPRWIRQIPKYVLAFDFCLLLYFFAGITDVNWASPLSLTLAFAIVLGAMVTLLSYGFLAFTGHQLRSYNHAGTIHPEDLGRVHPSGVRHRRHRRRCPRHADVPADPGRGPQCSGSPGADHRPGDRRGRGRGKRSGQLPGHRRSRIRWL